MMTDPSTESFSISKRSIRRVGVVVGAIVLAVVILVGAAAIAQRLQPSDGLANSIRAGEYQSLLLTNGQIYFGKLSPAGGDFYVLRHVYYLTQQASRSNRLPLRQLVPLVSDIHGPEDMMIINRVQIVYVENLRPNGKAAQLLRGSGP